MIEQLITIETAQLAKEKGFNENGIVWLFYEENGRLFNNLEGTGDQDYVCCTQELLRKWLSKTYNIDVWAKPFMVVGKKKYLGYSNFNPNKGENGYVTHDTYEDVIEMALQISLKSIKI